MEGAGKQIWAPELEIGGYRRGCITLHVPRAYGDGLKEGRAQLPIGQEDAQTKSRTRRLHVDNIYLPVT